MKVYNVHKSLSAISPMFSIAAAFGNVHGVYKSGNVVLSPHLLGEHQKYIKEQTKSSLDKPTFLVMHGGSGSTEVSIENNHLACYFLDAKYKKILLNLFSVFSQM